MLAGCRIVVVTCGGNFVWLHDHTAFVQYIDGSFCSCTDLAGNFSCISEYFAVG